MIDKYEEYPNGISEQDIQDAEITGLARIIEILANEYLENVNRELIDFEKHERYISKYQVFLSTFVSLLKSWDELPFSDLEKCLQISILTGSLLEATLQLFLLVFRKDFETSKWRIWHVVENNETVKFDFEMIIDRLKQATMELQDEGVIRRKQREDINEAIKNELMMRQKGRLINKMMIEELVRLFEHEEIFDLRMPDENGKLLDDDEQSGKNLIAKMDRIREARNNVHVFTESSIPSTTEGVENIRVLCSIMKDILFRIRCLNEGQRKEAFRELVLDIPGVKLIDVDDEYRIIDIHERKK